MPSVSLPTLAMTVGLSGEAVGTAATIGAALPSLSTVLTGASLIGTGLSAFGTYQQSRARSAAAGYNAKIAANNAQIATQNAAWQGDTGEKKVAISQQQTKSKAAAILANEGASGVDVNSPSFLGVRESASRLGKLDAMQIRSDAAKAAYGFTTQAVSDTAQSGLDRLEQESYKTGGAINAGATVLGGIGKEAPYQQWLSGGGALAGMTQ